MKLERESKAPKASMTKLVLLSTLLAILLGIINLSRGLLEKLQSFDLLASHLLTLKLSNELAQQQKSIDD